MTLQAKSSGWIQKKTGNNRQSAKTQGSVLIIPMGTTMNNRLASLPNFKSITSKHKETIIELFLSLQWAHNVAAKAAGYLASLACVLNADQFSYILKHSMRPLVQFQYHHSSAILVNSISPNQIYRQMKCMNRKLLTLFYPDPTT